jgi:glycine dehydrogenase subunit 2
LTGFHQARWAEPLIFDLSGSTAPYPHENIEELTKYLPKDIIRESLEIPNISEPRVAKHFIRLSQMNYSVDLGMYPLGSCTMKYNPKIADEIINNCNLEYIHPDQPIETVQGLLKVLYDLAKYLCEITGMEHCSLQPAAGAQGELTGVLIMKKYHITNNMDYKDEVIIPDSAHGTNPASAKMAGYKVVEVPSNEDGKVDISALRDAVSERTAGLMLTNPNTLGIFEDRVLEMAEIIHEVDGLMYYDGANLNAITGVARPGDMKFDIVHVNLHKTFGTPHGGGGPGAGPICVNDKLREYLPVPIITKKDGKYVLDYELKHTIGRVHSFYGNISVLLRAYIYIRRMGRKGIAWMSKIAVLNSNYLLKKISRFKGVDLPFNKDVPRKHEFVISLQRLKKDTGVTALDVAKRLLDFGVHAPTIYFPLIVNEAFMIEPTESVTKDELDYYAECLLNVLNESYSTPEIVKSAPHNLAIKRVREAEASRPSSMAPSYLWFKKRSMAKL